MMPKILVINPNTTQTVTDQVVAACKAAHPTVTWQGATGSLGANYIASEVAYALGAHAAMDAYARCFSGHDAVLLACFGDPGLLALQEIAAVPVVGLAQASFMAAGCVGRFAVVTGGKAWGPMLTRFAQAHQLDKCLAGIFTVELTGAQIAANPQQALASLADACALGHQAGAECILLGGAALTGLAPRLQAAVPIPVLDNVLLAAQAVVDGLKRGQPTGLVVPIKVPVVGVEAALSRVLA
jgi:allantoin racemase